MNETEYLLSSPENAKRLHDSIQELEEWSQEFKDLAGAWKDLPVAEEIRKPLDQDNLRSNRVTGCD